MKDEPKVRPGLVQMMISFLIFGVFCNSDLFESVLLPSNAAEVKVTEKKNDVQCVVNSDGARKEGKKRLSVF